MVRFILLEESKILIKKPLAARFKQYVSRGGPSVGHGCTHVHPIILANEIEVSR